MRRGAPTRALASEQVVRTFAPFVADAREQARQSPDHLFSMGMLLADMVTRQGGATRFCFAADGTGGAPLLLTLRPGGFYLVRAEPLPTETCPK